MDYPHYLRWFEAIDGRPAVRRAVHVLAEHQSSGPFDERQHQILFGATQYQQR